MMSPLQKNRTDSVAQTPFSQSVLVIADSDVTLDPLYRFAMESARAMRAATLDDVLTLLHTHVFDIALLDISLSSLEIVDVTALLARTAPDTPVVILSEPGDEPRALQALKYGADNYFLKNPGDERLIRRAIAYATERKHREERWVRYANYDEETGLATRAFFESQLPLAVARTKRTGLHIGVLIAGISAVEDPFGQKVDAFVLEEIGKGLTATFREYDTVAYLKNEEFAILLDGVCGIQDCIAGAQRVLAFFRTPLALAPRVTKVDIALGIALTSAANPLPAKALLSHAGAAMRHVKRSGAAGYHCAEIAGQPLSA